MQLHDHPSKPSVDQALKKYWLRLVVVGLFPTLFGVAVEFLGIPALVLIPFFFFMFGFAAWPCLSGRAPYVFWVISCGVWMAGGVVAVIVINIIKAMMG